MNTMTKVFEKNDADGMQVVVLKNEDTGKFHTILRDTDAGETVGVVICPTLDLALKHANKMVC